MGFKQTSTQFLHLDITRIEPNPDHPRKAIDPASLKGLVNSIEKKGLIHPLLVQPANAAGQHRLIVGERRRQAALLAGETTVPVLVRDCSSEEMLEIQVFENLGLGVRSAMEPRDMANALQKIAHGFASESAAAEQFGRSPNWLNQATAAAKLSPKVSALLDSGKIASTATAVQIEKLVQKDEVSAESLISQIVHLPEGEKLPKQIVDKALSEAGVRRRKKEAVVESQPAVAEEKASALAEPAVAVPPIESVDHLSAEATALPVAAVNPARRRVSPGKVRQVAEILGLGDDDEETILERLIDEFLANRSDRLAN